ncbi:MAG TPA: tRNA (guanosine(37)-N1)-methyltransferase TrmD [Candidatus Limnocylindrales bacterium]|nr:tRNA (guanosine(37)-N1)-methyltransferase TrmD [Candidatus Limnocylindrales bacterium]
MIAFDVLTLFPEFIEAGARLGVLGRAAESGLLAVRAHQLRNYTGGSPHPVDDSPYGGGPGMVMRPEPIYAAVEDITARFSPQRRVLLTPQGAPFTQAVAARLAAAGESMLLFCGRYEGVDERVRPLFDEEISIGDYVLTGGELGALVVIDAVARLVPGVLGSADSPAAESFSDPALLEYPQYTRPAEFRGMGVPSVLTSGNHAAIDRWRREQALERTAARRPDLASKKRD